MRKSGTTSLLAAVSCFLSLVSGTAQRAGVATPTRPTTTAESLSAYGIDISEPSLLAALSNTNPKVRVLAAKRLAHDRDADAIPAMEYALSNEKDAVTKVGLSGALLALHDPLGAEALRSLCGDTMLPPLAVFDAVQTLQIFQESAIGCAEAVLTSLKKPDDRDYRDGMLSLLPALYREASMDQGNQIVIAAQNLLRDRTQQPSVRLAAGQALAQIGLPSSAQALREALSGVDDTAVRTSLEADLNSLTNDH